MIRRLEALGLALLAVLAIGAVLASAASAERLTSDGPVKLTGHDAAGEVNTVTAFGTSVSCEGEYTVGLENQTPHTFFDPSIIFVAIFTVAPHYSNCHSGEFPATVAMNGCDYLVHVANGVETWEVVCPESAQIETRVYSNSSEGLLLCTVKVPGQTGITGGSTKNITEGGVEKISWSGPLESLNVTESGLCGSKSTEGGAVDLHAIIGGVNEGGGATGIKMD